MHPRLAKPDLDCIHWRLGGLQGRLRGNRFLLQQLFGCPFLLGEDLRPLEYVELLLCSHRFWQ